MRFAKTGAAAAILAGVLAAGAGVAHADHTVTVTAELLGCAARADIDVSALNGVTPGTAVTISDALAAQLQQNGCMP
ncbi:hypothetical protein D7D52_11805 [Nocardia yunnanensis]|uniref:Uncharacterized protein n=1 Tax=Nocardia yunnanensis TaxID=2382165 RepID=A0A386Z9V8_9NOCA|nr:hypothetical protein [Nocardia yunnanensis]AYF74430.1 hypothetical protein D7D52_11805 [Nocardia yunnanensis]